MEGWDAALMVMLVGTAVVLSRRRWARGFIEHHTTYDRAFNEDGVAFHFGVLGAAIIILGLVFLALCFR